MLNLHKKEKKRNIRKDFKWIEFLKFHNLMFKKIHPEIKQQNKVNNRLKSLNQWEQNWSKLFKNREKIWRMYNFYFSGKTRHLASLHEQKSKNNRWKTEIEREIGRRGERERDREKSFLFLIFSFNKLRILKVTLYSWLQLKKKRKEKK